MPSLSDLHRVAPVALGNQAFEVPIIASDAGGCSAWPCKIDTAQKSLLTWALERLGWTRPRVRYYPQCLRLQQMWEHGLRFLPSSQPSTFFLPHQHHRLVPIHRQRRTLQRLRTKVPATRFLAPPADGEDVPEVPH